MRLLLAVVALATIAAFWFAFYVDRAKHEAKLVEETSALAPKINYDYQFDKDTKLYDLNNAAPPGPAFLRRYFGEHLFGTVEAVLVRGYEVDQVRGHAVDQELEEFQKLLQFSNLREFALLSFHLENLSDISKIPKLESLHLVACSPISDLSPLSNAESLKQVALHMCPAIKDLTPLLDAPSLNSVILSRMDCDDYAVLKGLPNLKVLKIGQLSKEVADWSWIGEMKSLEELHFQGAKIKTFPSLSALTRLEKLVIDYDSDCPELESIAPFAHSKKLTYLKIRNVAPNQSVDVILELSNLEVLEIPKLTFSDEEIAELRRIRPNLKITIL